MPMSAGQHQRPTNAIVVLRTSLDGTSRVHNNLAKCIRIIGLVIYMTGKLAGG